VVLSPLPQYPVEARLRGDIDAAISKPRHDLAGRKAGKFSRIARGDDLVSLILAQPVRGARPLGKRAEVLHELAVCTLPALILKTAVAPQWQGLSDGFDAVLSSHAKHSISMSIIRLA